ncbi:hypothetical protein LIER_05023 [Lithospermum erythrorhizon]|uniref:Reverse transcriptase n=1 Tax=Lithospermum erythrorhizon TaxID=34254 RepID=A0AAV3P3N4_LITER
MSDIRPIRHIISNNILVAHEVLYYMSHNKKSKHASMAIKLDMSKVYGRVEWSFLEAIMLKLGFCRQWADWTMCLVSSLSYNFLINGALRGYVCPTRGIRQGRHCPSVSHILFADDSMIFCRATEEEGRELMKILEMYEVASGQRVNVGRSSINFEPQVIPEVREHLVRIIGIREVQDQGKYLGLPSYIGRTKKAVFAYMVSKVEEKIKGWKGKLLSQAGLEVMIKSVASAIPNFVMNCFKLSKGIIDVSNSLMAKKFWASSDKERGIH